MKRPKIVFFDYGQTLMNETAFDPLKGMRAVLETAVEDAHGLRAEDLTAFYRGMIEDINRPAREYAGMQYIEVSEPLMQRYLFGCFGIRPTKSSREIEMIFERNAKTAAPSPGIGDLLAFLKKNGIRAGVISNITMTGDVLAEVLRERIPGCAFDPVVASSDAIFRKPHPRIFRCALKRAGVAASEAFFCGDNPAVDLAGAAAAGIFPVWYRGCCSFSDDARPACRHLEVRSWKELAEAISALPA
jgi:putative hydrolase of the HAD superfamily